MTITSRTIIYHFEHLQCLPEESKNTTSQSIVADFLKIDKIFGSLRISEVQKNTIYKFLAAILHLGNLEFDNNDSDDGAHIVGTSEHHIEIVANLLGLEAHELTNHLLCHAIQVAGSQIS